MVVIVVNFADSGCRPFPTNHFLMSSTRMRSLFPLGHSHPVRPGGALLRFLTITRHTITSTTSPTQDAQGGSHCWFVWVIQFLLSFPTRRTFGILRLSFGMFTHGMSSLNCWCSFRFDHVTCCRITIRICWYVGIDFGSRLFPPTLC